MVSQAAYAPPAEGTTVAVATDQAEATRAALDTLQRGGNAFDAAISAALALGVVSPAASGLGGGGFALVYVAKDHKIVAVDFREAAPRASSGDALVARKARGVSVGVPGEPAGLEWLSTHGAKKTLAEDAAPAVRLARDGFLVGRYLGVVLTALRPLYESTPLATELLPGGSPLTFGMRWQRPALARSIERLGAEGKKPFYTGDLAAKIVTAVKAESGAMTPEDLTAYAVKERAPLSRAFGKRTVYTMPAPSAGGLMELETLAMWGADSTSPLHAMGFGSSAYLHMLAETMRGAIADRARISGDPDFETQVTASYVDALDDRQIAARRARIVADKTHPGTEFKTREDGTSHVLITDAEGNVVSLTTTVNSPFGARFVAGDTGIWLNDQLNDFALPEDVVGYGVVGLGPNVPHGGARPVSSMAPTIVLEDGVPTLALGGSGGRRIATAVTQAALARLVFGLDPAACVSSPRIFTNGVDVFVDPEISEDVRAGLRARGESVKDEFILGSAVQMMTWDRSGTKVKILAASDPRKMGFSAGY